MEDFEKIYKELKDEFNKDYLPPDNSKKAKLTVYLFFAWIISTTVEMIVGRILTKDSTVYSIIKLISIVLIISFILLIVLSTNKSVDYWKKSYDFKNKVGRKFWKLVNLNILYTPNREEIDNNNVLNELSNIYPNSKIVDVEDKLNFEDISMYTTRLDDSENKRITGTLVIINNCDKEIDNEEAYVKGLSLDITSSIYKIKKINNKLLFFLDAKEVFFYNNLNFFSEKELHDDYLRFADIITIKNSFKA